MQNYSNITITIFQAPYLSESYIFAFPNIPCECRSHVLAIRFSRTSKLKENYSLPTLGKHKNINKLKQTYLGHVYKVNQPFASLFLQKNHSQQFVSKW